MIIWEIGWIYIWLVIQCTILNSAPRISFWIFFLQRRISREGVLNEAASMGSEVTAIDLDESMHQLSRGSGNDGSSDPLLQIPTQLSAVLTMKRGSPQHRRSQSKQINTTSPLLKRKRESIVWSWEKNYMKDFLYNFYHMAVKKQNKFDTWKYKYHLIFVVSIF